MWRLMVLAAYLTPVHVFLVPAAPSMRPLAATATLPRAARLPAAVRMQDEDPYRTLGISEDAGYDAINDAYDELSERYAGDAGMITKLDAAKDKVVNNMLAKRMAGAAASYEGSLAVEDRKAPPKTPIWEIANQFRKRVIIPPKPAYAARVVGLMGGLAVCAWVAPSTASTTSLINTVSGMGFMYNRGEAEVPRDDFGQIGEIRPMKPRPFALTIGITAFVWILASIRTNAICANMAAATGAAVPKGLKLIIRTTFVSLGLIIPALFVRVMGVFPQD